MRLLPEKERQKLLTSLTDEEAEQLLYDWDLWARQNQKTPSGDWFAWLILAGRGFGKTRTGAETVRRWIESGQVKRIALVAETAADARDVMVEGESGILAISPKKNKPIYEPSKRRLTWPNGAIATTYSGDDPDQLRGPQHDKAWVDELAKMQYAQETWDNLELGLRLGTNPQCIITTTPRPIKIIKELIKDTQVVVTTGSSYENISNLASSFVQRVIKKYEGTRIGQQELHAKILDDTPGALWNRDILEDCRVTNIPDFKRIVVGVDPEATSEENSAETGIIIAALGMDNHGYVLEDMSIQASPDGWGKRVVAGYNKYKADRIAAEVNNGGEMVEFVIKTIDKRVSFKQLHASKSKQARAEPIAALYEQKKVHHMGFFADLEDQLCNWVPGEKSPDRLDALVWALTELMLGNAYNKNIKLDPNMGKQESKWTI